MLSTTTTTPPFLRIANYDIRYQIYTHLLPHDQEIHLLTPQTQPNDLLALSKTCRTTHAEIAEWYASHARQLDNTLQSRFGIFHAPSARFVLDIRDRVAVGYDEHYGEEALELDEPTERAWGHLARDPALRGAVRHLVIDGRVSDQYVDLLWPYYVLAEQIFPALSRFEKLASCELWITLKRRERYKEGDWYFEVMDIWRAFWEIMVGVCLPGGCCTCCVLPELRVRVCDLEGGKGDVLEVLPGEVGEEGVGAWYDLASIRDG